MITMLYGSSIDALYQYASLRPASINSLLELDVEKSLTIKLHAIINHTYMYEATSMPCLA